MPTPDALRVAIEAVHQAIADHEDPQAKQTLGVCLQNMLKVQANDYAAAQQNGGGGPRDQVVAQMGGGQ